MLRILPTSAGIIGGADGPTAIFITGRPLLPLLIGAGVLALVIVLAVLFLHKK